MVADDIQQKSQEEYKGGLDEILQFGGILAEARREHLMKIAEILARAVTEYIFDGSIDRSFISENEKTGEINIYLGGIARSQGPIFRSIGKKSYIGKVIYDFGGVVSIKDDKLKLELGRGRALREETYYNRKEMEKDEYERQKTGLYYLRKLSKMDDMLPPAIQHLEGKLYVKGVGERKRIDMEYNVLTGDLEIKVCGDDIMEGPEDAYRNTLYSFIHDYREPTERKCVELKGEKGWSGIWLNTNYIIEHNPYFLEKKQIPDVFDYILSEKTLKLRYDLKEHLEEQMEKEIGKMFSDRDE
jgi:hypothetical protein